MTRLGIIGPGLIWYNSHRDIVRALSDRFTVAAFSARSDASRRKAAADFPDAVIHSDYRDLITTGPLTLVRNPKMLVDPT